MKNQKKLNLLKPDVKTGYLDYGKGQEITYLTIPEYIGKEELKEDIDEGALVYKELYDFTNKKPSRFVILNCINEEEGLMAASYLASIYNKQEKLNPDNYEDDDLSDDFELEFEDFDDPFDIDEDNSDWEEDSQWVENPWKIPIVELRNLINADNPFFSPFNTGGMSFGRAANPRERLPFWYYTRKENLCIIHRIGEGYLAADAELICQKLKRYQNNRHVFLIVVNDSNGCNVFSDTQRAELSEVMLEYAAGSINLVASESDTKEYLNKLFENWITKYGFKLEKDFNTNLVIEKILEMNNTSKSALIEKTIKYVTKDMDTTSVLKQEDFDVIDQFSRFSVAISSKGAKSSKKLENEIVGMDSVKEQIKGIVEVTKYVKRRKKLGLKTGNYHNVHMLLGAPGTAKTTVAELLGNIMAEEKLLDGNRFISINGAELKGMYVGHSAPKVKALFDEHDIIFIDEAYAIASGQEGESDSFSQEAIAQLIVELEKHGTDRLVMFAGYGGKKVTEEDNKMKNFLKANPGIRSRINSTIYFDSYNEDQMVEIFKCHGKIGQYNVTAKADQLIKDFFASRVGLNDFGNGREARSLLENAMVQAAKRLANVPDNKITEKMLKEIKYEDIEKAIQEMQSGFVAQNKKTGSKFGFIN